MPTLRLTPSEIAAHRGPRPGRAGWSGGAGGSGGPRGAGGSGGRGPRRDPAPSRLGYKAHRLWLSPGFRKLLTKGLPAALALALVGSFLADPATRAAIANGAAASWRTIQTRPEFMVKMMAIEGASPVLAETVRKLLPVDFPISSFDLDLEAMQATIAALDVVESAEIVIRPGGVLEVAVTERAPVLVWRRGDTLELVDATGHRVATLTARAARPDLPLIVGWGADAAVDEALALLKAAGPLQARLRGLVRVGERRWDLVLDQGPVIMLPEAEPMPALARVLALDAADDLLARAVTHVDFRDPRRPVLRRAPPPPALPAADTAALQE